MFGGVLTGFHHRPPDGGLYHIILPSLSGAPHTGLRTRAYTPLHSGSAVAVPLQLRTEVGELAFISTTTIFGTPIDITVAELALESFFPANAVTAAAMQRLVRQS